MLTQYDHDPRSAQIAAEMRRLQNQISVLQTQNTAMLRLLSTIAGSLKELNMRDGNIEREVCNIEKEFEKLHGAVLPAGSCPACGAPLEHHRAETGDLRICSACGFSQFVDSCGVVRSANLPAPTPPADLWTPPTPWVG